MFCINCHNSLIDELWSFCLDTSHEVLMILEQQIGHEISADDVVCESCLTSVIMECIPEQNVNDVESLENENVTPTTTTDINVCAFCQRTLQNRRTHSLPPGPQRDHILHEIAPRVISDSSRVCFSCWRRSCRAIGVAATTSTFENNCVWCRCSLSLRRSNPINVGPERNLIQERVAPREIQPHDRVCYACWVAARRSVNRNNNPAILSRATNCLVCSVSLQRRVTHSIPTGSIREVILRRIQPREISEQSLLCNDCWTWVNNAEQQNIEADENEPISPEIHYVPLTNFRKIGVTSTCCFVPNCTNTERLSVPIYLKVNLLKNFKVFVTEEARICLTHKHTFDWDNLIDFNQLSNNFNTNEIEAMTMLSFRNNSTTLNFNTIDNFDNDQFRYWTGITKEQFFLIYNEIPLLRESCKIPKTALGLYLVKLRTGETHERLSHLFKMSTSRVSNLLKKARLALTSQFVPSHLGLSHISRAEIINKNLIIPEGLFGDREERKPIIIFDGTYIYLQKSSNYLFQKLTYSLHKYSNLVKPFLLVATDGHIIDVCGPYAATTTDSDIMKSLFQDENGAYRNYFMPGDIFILDRGFRDAIPLLEQNNYKIFKPESLSPGESQLSTIKANKSRLVTLCRWVVEVVNGRFKLQFKLFRQRFFNLAANHLMDDFKIGASIINCFHSSLVDRPDAEAILNRALQRVNMPNDLGHYIVQQNINRQRTIFVNIDGNHPLVESFPQMTHSDLILFALGIYQIKQARSYFGEHIRQNGSFVVEIQSEVMIPDILSSRESILIRGRIRSRHRGNKVYYTYILYDPIVSNWEQSIRGYYCNCICGMRTVGCCAHVMTVVWYLGWARHQENVTAPATFLDEILVREDI